MRVWGPMRTGFQIVCWSMLYRLRSQRAVVLSFSVFAFIRTQAPLQVINEALSPLTLLCQVNSDKGDDVSCCLC